MYIKINTISSWSTSCQSLQIVSKLLYLLLGVTAVLQFWSKRLHILRIAWIIYFNAWIIFEIIFEYVHLKPGPSSSEGDRPPTNPAIRVRFSPKQMNFSFSPWQKNAGLRFIRITLRWRNTKAPSTGKEAEFTFYLCVKGNVAR